MEVLKWEAENFQNWSFHSNKPWRDVTFVWHYLFRICLQCIPGSNCSCWSKAFLCFSCTCPCWGTDSGHMDQLQTRALISVQAARLVPNCSHTGSAVGEGVLGSQCTVAEGGSMTTMTRATTQTWLQNAASTLHGNDKIEEIWESVFGQTATLKSHTLFAGVPVEFTDTLTTERWRVSFEASSIVLARSWVTSFWSFSYKTTQRILHSTFLEALLCLLQTVHWHWTRSVRIVLSANRINRRLTFTVVSSVLPRTNTFVEVCILLIHI